VVLTRAARCVQGEGSADGAGHERLSVTTRRR
jgi:hypothetical protein